MKIAIVGSSGYIAGILEKRIREEPNVEKIIKIGNIRNTETVFLDLNSPQIFDSNTMSDVDILIFTAAISSPDMCSQEFEKCWSINVNGTKYVIAEALKKKCRVLFFSSDAVFGGFNEKIYNELSNTAPSTAYGKMKKAVEDEFINEEGFKAIRLSYVISAEDRFTSYCLNCIKTGEKATIFHPFYRNCVTANEVAQAVLWIINNWDKPDSSVLNIAGEELISRVRIADELNWLYKQKLSYEISYPGDDFYNSRLSSIQMQSIYLGRYNILSKQTFTERIKLELKGVTI